MEANVAGLAIASHPQNIHKTGTGTGTEFSILNIVNNLQYSHNLQMFMLINHQRWIPPLFKGKLQRVILHLFLHLIFVVMYRTEINFTKKEER